MAEAVCVLVVGAGPVGLTTAYELARRGVEVRLVDQAAGPATSSRALAVHARSLETFRQMGIVDELLPLGQRVVHFTLHQHGRILIRFDTNYDTLPTPFPFSLMVDQVVTERVLREATARLGIRVEWGVRLVGLRPVTDGAEAELDHADGRAERTVVPWLVGADGAHSVVRKSLGLRLAGDSTETWLNADVVLDANLPRDSNHLVLCRGGALLLVPFPEPGKWRIVDTVDAHDADDPEAVRARIEAKLSAALRRPVGVAPPTWTSAFTVQQRMIGQMRVGRCFVAGDAAHVHSPASGQGMNTGIQEGYNLAWKLAQVALGYADDALLDSYPAERVPVGQVLLRSTRKATALVALRNAVAPVALPAGLGLLSTLKPAKRKVESKIIRGFCGLGLCYDSSPLTRPGPTTAAIPPGHRVAYTAEQQHRAGWREVVAELADPRWSLLLLGATGDEPRLAERYPAAVSVRSLPDPDGSVGRAFGVGPGGFVLIRPDGYVAGAGQYAGPADLDRLLRSCHLRPQVPDAAPTAPGVGSLAADA